MADSPADLVIPADLRVFEPDVDEEVAKRLIKYATARAYRLAPCLRTSTGETRDEAQGIIIRAIRRGLDEGSGALQQWTNVDGPFTRSATVDTRSNGSHGVFYPTEEADLKSLCAKTTRRAKSAWLL